MFEIIVLSATSAVLTFIITILILRKLIPVLKSKKMGQPILEIGPRWHKSKEGTPPMGGIAFIAASVGIGIWASVCIAVKLGVRAAAPLILTLTYGLLCGLIGMIDDLAKLRKRQNEGLRAWQKLSLQLICAGLYVASLHIFCGFTTEIYLPFIGKSFDLGIWYYVIAVILLAGVDNSVNLNDGIDGLCSSITLVVALFFAAVSFFVKDGENASLSVLSSLIIGSAAGFLVYNFYPAKIFMGDTGSLYFGGVICGAAFLLGNPLIIVVAGLVYILETVSVILQVGYFKLTHGKRLFKMAPIHHHFEKCGFSEIKIVVTFSAVTVLLCVAAWFGL
ncbi:MAG: phospho-N-acetylmuramoyl-pentapeptide-transferase [Clostridia bacterium]|nr:phospho-N-acetylmuramoyl-pentapeptide-transferase [Clostridia bacterium]